MKSLVVALIGALTAATAARADAPRRPAATSQDFAFLDDPPPMLIRVHVEIDGQPLQRHWDDCLGRIFKHLDVNGDGVLDLRETAQAPPAVLFFPHALMSLRYITGAMRADSLAGLDANNDGKVTREELAEFYRKNGGMPFQFQGDASSTKYGRTFAAVSEFATISAGDIGVNEALFKLLDTDKNGKLSPAELAAGPDVLAKRDSDEDEMISVAEILPVQRRVNAYYSYSRSLPVSSGQNQIMLLSPSEVSVPLARQIVTRYSAKKPGNNLLAFLGAKLTSKELGMSPEAFAGLDTNKDGLLDPNELKHFAKKSPDLEFHLRLGNSPGFEPLAVKGAPVLKRTHAGSFILDRGPSRAVFRLDAGKPAPDIKKQLKSEFEIFDQDGNGYLERREATQSPTLHALFTLMDKDQDAKLFEKEVLDYLDSWGDLPATARASCVTLSLVEEARGLFDLLDANRDRRLSVREVRQLVKLVEQLDRNQDGALDATEFPRSNLLELRQGPAGSNTAVLDRIVGVRPDQMQVALPTRGPLWFRKMDRNRDGDVSPAEFLGTSEEFRRIDSDGDGLIDADEAKRFDETQRKTR